MAKIEVFEFSETDKRTWWTLIVGGIVSVLFGFVAIIWPGITVGVLAILLAIFIGVYGVINIIRATHRFSQSFFSGILTLILGLIELGVSVYMLSQVGTGLDIAVLILVIAISFLARGVIGIVLAFDGGASSGTRWYNAILGILAIVVALVIVSWPAPATLVWIWVVGFFALVTGAMEISLGFMAKHSLEGKK